MIPEYPYFIGVKVSPAQQATVQGLADQEQTTISAIVRRLIEEAAEKVSVAHRKEKARGD
jgi:hypothetical protein